MSYATSKYHAINHSEVFDTILKLISILQVGSKDHKQWIEEHQVQWYHAQHM